MQEKIFTRKAGKVAPHDKHLSPSIGGIDPEKVRERSKQAPPIIVQMGRTQNESGVIWITAIFMAIFHLGAIAALFFFSWTNLIVAAVLYVLAVNCGIGMGFHRLLVHRGYQVPKAVEYFLTVCGTLALEGGPIAWVATHRIHHQHSDRLGDPHTSTGWHLVGPHGLDRHWPRSQYSNGSTRPLRSRSRQGPRAGLVEQIPLGSVDHSGDWPAVGGNSKRGYKSRSGAVLMGHIPAGYARSPCHLAGELRNPSSRWAALCNPRRFS